MINLQAIRRVELATKTKVTKIVVELPTVIYPEDKHYLHVYTGDCDCPISAEIDSLSDLSSAWNTIVDQAEEEEAALLLEGDS